jgi:hypothetical protein
LSAIVERFEEPEAWLEEPRTVNDDEIKDAGKAFEEWEIAYEQMSDYVHLASAIFKAGTDPNMDFIEEQYSQKMTNVRLAMNQYVRGDFEPLMGNRSAIVAIAEAAKAHFDIEELRRRGMIERNGLEYPEEYEMSNRLLFTIEGLEAGEGETLLISQKGIEKMLVNLSDYALLFPTYFMRGIGKMKFEMGPRQEERVQRIVDNNWVMDGHAMEQGIKEIIVHEVFEHAATKLTLEEMRAWMAAIEADKAAGLAEFVTPYPQYASEMPGEYRWEKEDFCETGRLFVLDAFQLLDTAPARFEFMLDYFARHLPPGQDNAIRDTFRKQVTELAQAMLGFMKKGKSEDVTEIWLEHQQPERREEIKKKAEAKKNGEENGFVTAGHYEPATENGEGGETIVVHEVFKLPEALVDRYWPA